ncbi:MlaD family protein [Flavobacterium cellulosilyticum]|uniref:MCE family protein n=1 Tax=Flavobacterium cellulosilyticum TaxID=2541731 RepID=A0A4R5CFF6_9FLAO|nr:MlaD family protein [Flavobacterium cellulosilyticum]TDD95964.1 MCE family protein [Flavobacterium cellulosilyticum]
MKLTREIKTAILVISAILLFIWGYSFLKGKDLFNNYKTVYVEYENVEGVARSAAVTLNGFVVGKVSNISLNSNSGKILVELQLKTEFPISKSSIASIYEPGFIAGKQIAIYPNLNDKSILEDGDRIQGDVKAGLTEALKSKLVPLQEKFEKLILNSDKLVIGINNVFDKKGQQDMKKSLAELSKTMEEFHKASTSINSLLDDNKVKINGVVTNFNKVSSDFSKISDSLNKANLGKTVKNLQKTLASVDKIITDLKAGKGSMGKMLNDDALYSNLNNTSKELELLLQDVRLHPTRYINVSIFGKKDKPYVAPVKDTVAKVIN